MKHKTIYESAVKSWGKNSQLDMLIEESAELIAAINRYRRGRTSVNCILEEIADVEIMIGQMRVMFDTKIIDQIKEKKLIRLIEKMGIIQSKYGKS